jgi:2-iminobutanoate/2-iminopropanoate deaminase
MQLRTVLSAGLVAVALSIASSAAAQEVRHINPNSATNTGGSPFSGAVLVGNTLYMSGMLGRGDTAEAAAFNVLDAMRDVLAQADMTMDDLVNVQIFAASLDDYSAFNTAYRGYFRREFPARAFIGAGSLLANARFEVIGIAVKR